ncbi:unnamed protein product [Didymodactylos carnosus]|uniref:Uncharacterized protein n=1 Tax=Didymodactylos carnosus TaxID=1234261 RepID=A0A814KV34_9BILA|nr:unnamed protein product [Didymodactylos carnosus]CAF1057341.1 unnamed protein product [Didymodactylos carnosus]CAF3541969.1 unnamed protein product [Didymodactylos carnosus]CAF3826161.1 unnamed protein product [Didymodactylos carnosus]
MLLRLIWPVLQNRVLQRRKEEAPTMVLKKRELITQDVLQELTDKGGSNSDEASSFIRNAVQTYLNRHVRAFTLCGQVLAKDPLSLEKAKSFLERALNLNQTYVEAVVSLVEVYNQLKQ